MGVRRHAASNLGSCLTNQSLLSQAIAFMMFYICNMKKGSIIIAGLIILFSACTNSEKPAGSNQTNPEKDSVTVAKKKTIVFYGNSLTAGYGLSPSQAFPAIIQKKIDSLGLSYEVINAGVSGETSSGGKTRIDWILRQPVDIFILELGANDGLRGIPLSETKKNLQDIIDRVKAKYPSTKLIFAGMEIPPNMGQEYTTEFRNIYKELATKNAMTLVPFLLEGVGGEPTLNQGDGIHPTAEGHRIVAENLWRQLEKLL
jgi:acyl-CoA thioesterase I